MGKIKWEPRDTYGKPGLCDGVRDLVQVNDASHRVLHALALLEIPKNSHINTLVRAATLSNVKAREKIVVRNDG